MAASAHSEKAKEEQQLSEEQQQLYDKVKPSALLLWPRKGEHKAVEERSGKWMRLVFHNKEDKESLPLFGGRIVFNYDLNKIKKSDDSVAEPAASDTSKQQVYDMRLYIGKYWANGGSAACFDAALAQIQQLIDILAEDEPLRMTHSHNLPLFPASGDPRGILLTLPDDPNTHMARAEDRRIDPGVVIIIDGRQQRNLTRGQFMRLVIDKEYAVKGNVHVVALLKDDRIVIKLYICRLDMTRILHTDRMSETMKADSKSAATLALF